MSKWRKTISDPRKAQDFSSSHDIDRADDIQPVIDATCISSHTNKVLRAYGSLNGLVDPKSAWGVDASSVCQGIPRLLQKVQVYTRA
jgi:hypothetical protein